MSATERLILEIETYCSRTGIAPSTFGKYAADDGKLVPRLKNGGRVTLETAERLRAYMRQHKRA